MSSHASPNTHPCTQAHMQACIPMFVSLQMTLHWLTIILVETYPHHNHLSNPYTMMLHAWHELTCSHTQTNMLLSLSLCLGVDCLYSNGSPSLPLECIFLGTKRSHVEAVFSVSPAICVCLADWKQELLHHSCLLQPIGQVAVCIHVCPHTHNVGSEDFEEITVLHYQ